MTTFILVPLLLVTGLWNQIEYSTYLGIQDRDMKKGAITASYCLLALSSEGKIGCYKGKTQLLHRWIDQGTNEAIAIVEIT
jgi:hypothetical protein